MDDVTIADIEKSKTETLRIRLTEFYDKPFLDLRVFYEAEGGELKPTKKGVAIPLAKATDVIQGLQAGLAKAEGLGLVNGGERDSDRAPATD